MFCFVIVFVYNHAYHVVLLHYVRNKYIYTASVLLRCIFLLQQKLSTLQHTESNFLLCPFSVTDVSIDVLGLVLLYSIPLIRDAGEIVRTAGYAETQVSKMVDCPSICI